MHITAYLLYLLSLVYFFFTIMRPSGEQEIRQYFVSSTIKTAFSSLSQIVLAYIFWSIHKMSNPNFESFADEYVEESWDPNISNSFSVLSRSSTINNFSIYEDAYIAVLVHT